MSYQLKIGTTSYQAEIQDTDTWSQTVVRDFREKLLRIRGNYSFKAWNALYDVLYTDTVANGVCSSLTGKVYFKPCNADYEQVWEGQLKAQDGEFDLIKGSVDHQVLDNSWSAQFNNSEEQKVNLESRTSINSEFISATTYSDTEFFDPADGSFEADTRKTYRVLDCFTFLTNYLTNGTVTFTSSFFEDGGDGEQYHIAIGKELRLHSGFVDLETSFAELFEEMDKKFNLWIIVEGTYNAPVIRIEQEDYALDEDIVIDVENPETVIMKTDLDRIYTSITIGGETTEYDPTNDASYPNRPRVDWESEDYNTQGDCMFENNELDLSSSFRIDSNSIEQCLLGSEDFDDDIFIVEVNNSTSQAIKYENDVTDVNSNIDYFYNKNLTNDNVLINWFGFLPTLISDNYHTYVITPQALTATGSHQIVFTDDTTPPAGDPDDLYTTPSETAAPVSGYFRAPVSGTYTFDISISVKLALLFGSYSGTLNLIGFGMDALFVIDEKQEINLDTYSAETGTVTTIRTVEMSMEAGDFAYPVIRITSGGAELILTGYFIVNGGATKYDISSPFETSFLYDIQKFKLSKTNYDLITANKEKRIRFKDTKTGREWKVWAKEMTYSHQLSEVVSGEFIGYAPENPLCWVLDGQFDLSFWDDFCYWVDEYGWIDCSSTVVSNPDITGNPVGTWSLLLGTNQTGEGTFTDPAGGPVYDVYLRQTIELPAGTYTLYASASISAVDTTWAGEFTLTGASGLGSLWTSTDLSETTATTFTVTGSSTRTLTARFAANIAASPTYTINQINIC